MSRRTLLTAVLLGALGACGDSPTAENSTSPALVADTAAAVDTTTPATLTALRDSAAALLHRDERPVSSVCARRVTELRGVRVQLGDTAAKRSWNSLKSKELMLSAAISDACY